MSDTQKLAEMTAEELLDRIMYTQSPYAQISLIERGELRAEILRRLASALPAKEARGKWPIDRPCSACSAGDTKMEYHDHGLPKRYTSLPGQENYGNLPTKEAMTTENVSTVPQANIPDEKTCLPATGANSAVGETGLASQQGRVMFDNLPCAVCGEAELHPNHMAFIGHIPNKNPFHAYELAHPCAGSGEALDLEPLKRECDRAWESESPQQVINIVANAMYWRKRELSQARERVEELERQLALAVKQTDSWIANANREQELRVAAESSLAALKAQAQETCRAFGRYHGGDTSAYDELLQAASKLRAAAAPPEDKAEQPDV